MKYCIFMLFLLTGCGAKPFLQIQSEYITPKELGKRRVIRYILMDNGDVRWDTIALEESEAFKSFYEEKSKDFKGNKF